MKTTRSFLLLGLLGMTGALVAQQDMPPFNGPGPGGHRPPPLIVGTLDANHDGVIDADEIAKASKALQSLDQNGDGKLTPEEFDPRPPHPRGPAGSRGDDLAPERAPSEGQQQ
jgi:hypothetical protein